MKQINSLTALRGYAALWVCAYHGIGAFGVQLPGFADNFVRSGWLAVDLFFILSGFVISFAHLKDFEAPGFAGRFLKLRLARVYPAHLVAALLWLPVLWVALQNGTLSPGVSENFNLSTFLHAVTLTNGWGLPNSEGWNLPSWSVGSEWFAYLAFPLVAPMLLRVKSARGYAAVAFGTLAVTTAMAVAIYGFSKYMLPAWGMVIRVESEFVVGCCMYGIYRGGFKLPKAVMWAAVAGVVALGMTGQHGLIDGAYIPLFALIVLGLPAMKGYGVFLGKISYSIYLMHALVIAVMRQVTSGPWWALAYMGLAVLAGWALYALVEEPARKAIRKRIATSTGSDDR